MVQYIIGKFDCLVIGPSWNGVYPTGFFTASCQFKAYTKNLKTTFFFKRKIKTMRLPTPVEKSYADAQYRETTNRVSIQCFLLLIYCYQIIQNGIICLWNARWAYPMLENLCHNPWQQQSYTRRFSWGCLLCRSYTNQPIHQAFSCLQPIQQAKT